MSGIPTYIENSFKQCCYCGNSAHYQFKNGKWCCKSHQNKCVAKKTTGSIAWNKGLTKNTDKRVKQYSKNMVHTKQNNKYVAWNKGLTKDTDKRVKQYADKMHESKIGKPNYKNRKPINIDRGLSANEFKFQLSGLLYTHWKFPIMKRDGFKCTKCGSIEKLEVHHLIPHREIFKESILKNNLKYDNFDKWNNDNFKKVIQTYLDLHILDIGTTVCLKCHCEIDNYRKLFIKDKE